MTLGTWMDQFVYIFNTLDLQTMLTQMQTESFEAMARQMVVAQVENSSDVSEEILNETLGPPVTPTCLGGDATVSYNYTFKDLFIWFDSDEEMTKYVQSHRYGFEEPMLAAGLVFHEVSDKSLNYTLRFNHSDVPDVTSPYVDKYGKSPTVLSLFSLYKYYVTGFLGWQNAIDQTFLFDLNETVAKQLKIGLHQFPFADFYDDPFWTAMKYVMPLVLAIAFSFPFALVTKTLVEEKSMRLREAYKILGGSQLAYILSYLIFYVGLVTCITLLLTVILGRGLFTYSDPVLLFITVELFVLNMIILSMLVSTFFNHANMAGVCSWVFFMGLYYLHLIPENSESPKPREIVCLSAPSAFALGIKQFAQYEEYQIGISWVNAGELDENTHFRLATAIWFMVLDLVLTFPIMMYTDRVFPTKYGVRRPWYSPFGWLDKFPCWVRFNKRFCCRKDQFDNLRLAAHVFAKSGKTQAVDEKNIEVVDDKELGKPVVSMRSLTKVYNAEDGRNNLAVNQLNLELYRNQVFCLLGHNGTNELPFKKKKGGNLVKCI
ncbi:hypothetical protein RFI_11920 [Reticulomyxa filosa]|uniref:ABC-2 type transporter transmembrane domain-containing protein n=1 Tax=Reticulomyxa filosa TaxID=46433 RepID=X6NIP4_RETFI|nr:hypothetical protein RFI_11920 [Reticulomyxa filosa]|eukprot:ETO25217.1 hypothetical protein RFI_11920 [Reticulomyxa filosa]